MSKNVLALVAHADDEVLGCGGALAKHVENGDIVKLITMTNGVGARTTDKSSELNRQNSLLESCVELGIV
ncbi:MAG: GlcNAc-PI de-N-acetylase, partial [Halobacteriovoraceae bacterium]|nr:GlcNAc-PI de-N-acetylase [Halobacteriovoraceae bacterium]